MVMVERTSRSSLWGEVGWRDCCGELWRMEPLSYLGPTNSQVACLAATSKTKFREPQS